MTWFAIRWWILVVKNRKCWNCKKKIKSHWETCPYCQSVQNKRKNKKLQKLQTTDLTNNLKKEGKQKVKSSPSKKTKSPAKKISET
jgi:hypothetical protein